MKADDETTTHQLHQMIVEKGIDNSFGTIIDVVWLLGGHSGVVLTTSWSGQKTE